MKITKTASWLAISAEKSRHVINTNFIQVNLAFEKKTFYILAYTAKDLKPFDYIRRTKVEKSNMSILIWKLRMN